MPNGWQLGEFLNIMSHKNSFPHVPLEFLHISILHLI